VGPLSLGKKEEEIFLGKEFARHRDYSERTAEDIDNEIRRVVENAEKRAEGLIRSNLDKLHSLASALLEREILDGHEIELIISGKKLRPKIALKKRSGRRRRKLRKPEPAYLPSPEKAETPAPMTMVKSEGEKPAGQAPPSLPPSSHQRQGEEGKRRFESYRRRGRKPPPSPPGSDSIKPEPMKKEATLPKLPPKDKPSAPSLLSEEDFQFLSSLDRLELERKPAEADAGRKAAEVSGGEKEKPAATERKPSLDSEPKTPSHLRRAAGKEGGMIRPEEEESSGDKRDD